MYMHVSTAIVQPSIMSKMGLGTLVSGLGVSRLKERRDRGGRPRRVTKSVGVSLCISGGTKG